MPTTYMAAGEGQPVRHRDGASLLHEHPWGPLAGVLDCRSIGIARVKLDEWLTWASRSRLSPFVKLARTVRKYREGILEYVRDRLNNGRVEGLNGKIRTITRRSYGFHSAA